MARHRVSFIDKLVCLVIGVAIGIGVGLSWCTHNFGSAADNIDSFSKSGKAMPIVEQHDIAAHTTAPLSTSAVTALEIRRDTHESADQTRSPSATISVSGAKSTSNPQLAAEPKRKPVSAGCYTVKDRATCCLHTDGRKNENGGYDCVPAPYNRAFVSGNICETGCYILGTCGGTKLGEKDILSCRQVLHDAATLSKDQLLKLDDPSGPEGLFTDWMVTPEAGTQSAAVGFVLLKHQSVHQFDFEIRTAPDWAKMIFAANRDFCKRHGYKMLLREGGHAKPTQWQSKSCSKKHKNVKHVYECERQYDRENSGWEKIAMMFHYLDKSGGEHFLVLDVDAAFVHKDQDTVRNLIKEVNSAGKDVLVTNKDYEKAGGASRLDCSLIFAKNTDFSRALFRDLLQSHLVGPEHKGPGHHCTSACECFHSWLGVYPKLDNHLLVVSGTRYNRQECTFRCCTSCSTNTVVESLSKRRVLHDSLTYEPYEDPNLEILHFASGNSRGSVHNFFSRKRQHHLSVEEFLRERTPDANMPGGQIAADLYS